MKTLFTLLFTLSLLLPARANLVVELSIENQMVDGSDFYFDLYLTRHADSHGDIFLADMDLVLNFNAQFFTAPELTPVENDTDETGLCLFSPTTATPMTEADCRAEYFSKTATTQIVNDLLIINLLGPEPPDATTFDGLIAWVDGQPSKHRLGRFKISGINDQMGTAGLVWAETQTGTMTKVFSFENFAPWEGKPVEVKTTLPPDVGLDSTISSTVEKLNDLFLIESIYPNPVEGELNINVLSEKNMEADFIITNSVGHILFQKNEKLNSGNNKITLDLIDLPTGIFNIFIENKGIKLGGIFMKN